MHLPGCLQDLPRPLAWRLAGPAGTARARVRLGLGHDPVAQQTLLVPTASASTADCSPQLGTPGARNGAIPYTFFSILPGRPARPAFMATGSLAQPMRASVTRLDLPSLTAEPTTVEALANLAQAAWPLNAAAPALVRGRIGARLDGRAETAAP
jgi:hypothetical protein